ncbi:MAG: hypothetical protein Q7S52_03320 [bacterium]|nr:hypothetical protein [bacterium]
MAWVIKRTESFDKWWKKEDVEDGNYKFHEKALQEFRNIPLPHNVQTNIFKNASFECWITRLPDKDRNKGKSGGFRVVLVLDIEDDVMLLQGIFRRDNLSFQGQGGKYDDAHKQLLKDLAREFAHPS